MKERPRDCGVMRHVLVTHGTLSTVTGAITAGKQEWVTRPCGVPIFTDEERNRGTCKGCHGGWEHPNNYSVAHGRPAEEKGRDDG